MPQFERSLCWRFTAAFAVLLIAGLGFVQSVHLHDELAPSSAARSHCAICVFSHSPAVVTATGAAPAPSLDFATIKSSDPQLLSQLLVSSAFIRPPPVS